METYSKSCDNVFDEYDPLKFNNDEVQEIVDFLENTFNRLSRYGMIASRSHLTDNTFIS